MALRDWVSGKKGTWTAAVLVLFAFGIITLHFLRKPSPTPFLRGKKLAGELGCFACHGPGGIEGVPNPGSEDGDVPSWSGGTAMMYLESDTDIREYIRHGHKENADHEHEEDLISMPAYGDVLFDDGLDDLVAYVKAVSFFYPGITERAEEGYRSASENGCFGCHGPGGRGGTSNPGSFKGIIPGWDGDDYTKTVKDEEELREWVAKGTIRRFEKNPMAKYFLRRQKIQMPAYEKILTYNDVDKIVAYIRWLRG